MGRTGDGEGLGVDTTAAGDDLGRATGSDDGERRQQDGHDAGGGHSGSIGDHERISHPSAVIRRPAANDARLAAKATASARRGPRPRIVTT